MLILAAVLSLAAMPCYSDVVYNVVIDTTDASGYLGAIYMQFAPGLNSDPASIRITDFQISSPGVLSSDPPWTTGAVSGSLDILPLTISNTDGLNDYLHFLTYGSQITFRVAFDLPAALTGDSGSTFGFGLTADDGWTPILTEDPSGFAGLIGYDEAGTFSVTPLSTVVSIERVPEPVALPLIGLAVAALLVAPRRLRPPRD
jgi:hypothetical protein